MASTINEGLVTRTGSVIGDRIRFRSFNSPYARMSHPFQDFFYSLKENSIGEMSVSPMKRGARQKCALILLSAGLRWCISFLRFRGQPSA